MKDSKNSSYRKNPSGIAWVDTSFLAAEPQMERAFFAASKCVGPDGQVIDVSGSGWVGTD
jgi:hypothetical protein